MQARFPGYTADTVAALIAALLFTFAFALIAVPLIITLVESYIVVGAGVFLLGFAASRGTSNFTVVTRLPLLRWHPPVPALPVRGIGHNVAEDWIVMIDTMSWQITSLLTA